jgi:mannose-6-phosphate isomerase-like protein (cupin superfamily)
VNVKRLADAVAFSAEKMAKNALFDSPHMFYDLYCLRPGQAQKVHAHDGSDKVYLVMEGEARVTVGGETRALGAGHAVLAPAGEAHGVANDGPADLVLLVTMAPRP